MTEQDAKHLLVQYLGEHWADFESFCEQRGEDAEAAYQAIGGEE